MFTSMYIPIVRARRAVGIVLWVGGLKVKNLLTK
jgi:hypothetical protein